MAFRAKTVNGDLFSKNEKTGVVSAQIDPGPGPTVTVDGVEFAGSFLIHAGEWDDEMGFGVPTAAQIADDRLYIEDMRARPWPGAAADRAGQGKSNELMFRQRAKGLWPDKKEKALQRNAHARLSDPQEFVRRMGKLRGLKQSDIDMRVAMASGHAYAESAPDLGMPVGKTTEAYDPSAAPKGTGREMPPKRRAEQ